MCVCLYICMCVLSQDTFWTRLTNRFFEIRSKSAGPALPFELAHGNTLKVICVLLIYRTVAQKPLPLDPFSPLSPFSFPVAPTEPLAQMNNVCWWPLNLSKENSALWQSSLLPIFQFKPLSSAGGTDYANMKPWNNCCAEKLKTAGSCGHIVTSTTIAKGTSYGSNCSKPLWTLSILTASAKMSWMILAVNMIINYTCVRTNGLSQHKRTSMLNWKTKEIIRGSIISLGY